ncbi:MAG: MBL fold metallo-hydrolase [Actinomycetota bacterium]
MRPAATLVVLKDSPEGPQVLLTRRPREMRFMGGAVVFPGGAVASADLDPRWEAASALSPAGAARLLGEPDPAAALAALVCALRESFEEVGFLAGRGPLQRLGREEAEDPGRFLERCLELSIVLGTDRLVPAGRWVTPAGAPARFDTRFFATAAAPGWRPEPHPTEVAGRKWATPAAALADLAAGRASMAPPTVDTLQVLEGRADVAAALEALGGRVARGPGATVTALLAPLVHVAVAPNPGPLTGPGTNTYVIGGGPRMILDPAVDDPDFLSVVLEAAGEVAAVLVTHRHPDHTGGVRAIVERTGAPVRAFSGEAVEGVTIRPLRDSEVVEAGGVALRALHTPGHAADHLCFFLEDERILFSGDNVLGEGTSVIAPPDGNMRAYLGSLRRMRALPARRIFPGHFRALEAAPDVLDGYIAHRAEREARIIAALAAGDANIDEIVERAYSDTPQEMHQVAKLSAHAHLEMLEEDGRVTRGAGTWSLVEP